MDRLGPIEGRLEGTVVTEGWADASDDGWKVILGKFDSEMDGGWLRVGVCDCETSFSSVSTKKEMTLQNN